MPEKTVDLPEKVCYNDYTNAKAEIEMFTIEFPVKNTGAGMDEALTWSMKKYRSSVDEARDTNGRPAEAWDELEKSIVASIADEVTVRIKDSGVAITIEKAF